MESSTTIIMSVVMTIGLYMVYGSIYRLYFSPISKFPGPKLAALTFWYEFYFDVVRRGSYTLEIGKMHKEYGTLQIPNNTPQPL